MTQDIAALVERLRHRAEHSEHGDPWCDEAAEVIERLERERDEARQTTGLLRMAIDELVQPKALLVRAIAAEKDAAELRAQLKEWTDAEAELESDDFMKKF